MKCFFIISINVFNYANDINIMEKGGAFFMKHNDSIGCAVTECKNHCKDDNFCTLNKIEVIKHESVAKTPECTDCASFKTI